MSTYLSKDLEYMHGIHNKVKLLSNSMDTAQSSWSYLKKQAILNDLYTFVSLNINYVPLYVPCVNTSPDILYITDTESIEVINTLNKITDYLKPTTSNIHRLSFWKNNNIEDISNYAALTQTLISEIKVLSPKYIICFGNNIFTTVSTNIDNSLLFEAPYLPGTELKGINNVLLELIAQMQKG